MRVILFSAILATSYAYENSGEYIRLKIHASAAINVKADITDGAAACVGAVLSNIMLRIPKVIITAADTKGFVGDTQGACLSFDKTGDVFTISPLTNFNGSAWATPMTGSIAVSKHATAGTYQVWKSATAGCQTLVVSATGFQGLASQADCGGDITAAPNANSGIDVGLPTAPKGAEMTGVLYQSKKYLAMDLVGPYDVADCSTLTDGATRLVGNHPLILPLEDAAATPTADAATGITSNNKVIQDFSTAAANKYMIAMRQTTTPGQLIIHITFGAGAAIASDTSWTEATSSAHNHHMTFTVGMRGDLGYCMASYKGGTDVGDSNGKYFKLIPHALSFGSFPNAVALPSVTPTACPSPANGLHLSATVVALVALISMMM